MAEDIVLSDLQLDLMRVLWRSGDLSVAEVTEALADLPVGNPPDIVHIPLADVVGRCKTVPLDYDLLTAARAIGVSLGD